jgi:pyrimidine deaminase RibD-like protein
VKESDIALMREAILWAEDCKPKKDSIPKVGAVIAVDGKAIGRGRRGTGNENDDEHAELAALQRLADNKSQLPQATLYTTLEPCTREVRTRELECCTELILQHKIKKVFVGILDPNQSVTGKGVSTLQNSGVEVVLFPHDLAQQIRAMNADFIRCQQTLGAIIITPKNGDSLETSKKGGKQTIRLKCLNSPTDDNYLLTSRNGLYWPQRGPFRQIEEKVWEIDAYFGTTGTHSLHIVTATEIGKVLIDYYRLVVRQNLERREKLKELKKLTEADLNVLGGDYFGIPMTSIPKGLRSEASINVTIC